MTFVKLKWCFHEMDDEMPEYLSVEVYCCYPEETLAPFLDDTRQLLRDLGYRGENAEFWV